MSTHNPVQPVEHALLSASSAHRWLQCPPSAKLGQHAEQQPETFAAREGTVAHEMAKEKVEFLLHIRDEFPSFKKIPEGATLEEMDHYANEYGLRVLEVLSQDENQHPIVKLEQRVDYSHIVPDGFGTADCVIIRENFLHIIDFKYGKGIRVQAAHNPQLMLYALGALNTFPHMLKNLRSVTVEIFQPRIRNYDLWTVTVEELQEWANTVVQPAAQLATKGEGDFRAGTWCMFCPVAQTCRARAEDALQLARKEFADPALLEDEEIADLLQEGRKLKKWVENLEEYAHTRLQDGHTIPGLVLGKGRATREFTDLKKVEEICAQQGHIEATTTRAKTPAELERELGRAWFATHLGEYVARKEGKPKIIITL